MIFGRHIYGYYIKHGLILWLGLAALILVDYFQLLVPELFRMLINGMNTGSAVTEGGAAAFDLDFLLMRICVPMIVIILVMVAGRFFLRGCFFCLAVRVAGGFCDPIFFTGKYHSHQDFKVKKGGKKT